MKDNSGDGCGRDSMWPVGSKADGASPYGAQDMAGNAKEWVADWFDRNYYARSPKKDPQGPSSGQERVVRGGAWCDFYANITMQAAARDGYAPLSHGFDVSVRCARTVQQ